MAYGPQVAILTPQQESALQSYLADAIQAAGNAGHGDAAQAFRRIEEYFRKRLWHELSVELEMFIALPSAKHYLVDMYHRFVSVVEPHFNKISLVAGVGVAVARMLESNESRIVFLTNLAARVVGARGPDADANVRSGTSSNTNNNKSSSAVGQMHAESLSNDLEAQSAQLLAQTHATHYHLLEGRYELVAQRIREMQRKLDSLGSVDPRVACAFYRVAADCYKAEASYARFYHTSLLFLSSLSGTQTTLSDDESLQITRDLGLAVLLSDEIYNFGELLAHPIQKVLESSPEHSWLRNLLLAVNGGDISAFDCLQPRIASEPLLAPKAHFLRQKVSLMGLIDLVFQRSARDRNVSFADIAARVHIGVLDVEHLVMRAMARRLITGSIDQLRQVVVVESVAPRTIDRDQMHSMSDMLQAWKERVGSTTEWLCSHSDDLFSQA